eukprot:357674-Pyramimonas_sp.AAC.1
MDRRRSTAVGGWLATGGAPPEECGVWTGGKTPPSADAGHGRCTARNKRSMTTRTSCTRKGRRTKEDYSFCLSEGSRRGRGQTSSAPPARSSA